MIGKQLNLSGPRHSSVPACSSIVTFSSQDMLWLWVWDCCWLHILMSGSKIARIIVSMYKKQKINVNDLQYKSCPPVSFYNFLPNQLSMLHTTLTMLVYVTIFTMVIIIVGIIVMEITKKRQSYVYNDDGDTDGDADTDDTHIVIEHDQEDLIDYLYEQDNDINHLVEIEAERIRQKDRGANILQRYCNL